MSQTTMRQSDGPPPSPLAFRHPAWALAAVLVLAAAAGCRDKGTALTSDPEGATVWLGEEILGQTPLRLSPALPYPVTLRLAKPGCTDQQILVENAQAGQGGEPIRVTLLQPGRRSLQCESVPAGADVHVDGEFRGRTPLVLQQLGPRPVELVFMMANRRTVAETVDLSVPEPPATVRVTLPSLTEEFYRQQIEREPRNIHHQTDLAHHYVLEHAFDKAAAVFSQAVTLIIQTPGIADASRLWSEIERVIEVQYEYGDATVVANARRAMRDMLAALLKQHPDPPFPQLHLAYILALDSLNERQRAQEAFEQAWRRFPNDRSLQPLRRKGFAIP